MSLIYICQMIPTYTCQTSPKYICPMGPPHIWSTTHMSPTYMQVWKKYNMSSEPLMGVHVCVCVYVCVERTQRSSPVIPEHICF